MKKSLQYLKDNSWCFEAWTEHPPGKVIYVAKVTCYLGARGRDQASADTLEEAIKQVVKQIKERWE